MVDRIEVYEAADQVRSEGLLVSHGTVRARLLADAGRSGSPRDVGPLVLDWKADRDYEPILERGEVPSNISTLMEKATVSLWKAAQAEADQALQRDRERFEATLRDERALRAETLAMADGLIGQVDALAALAKDLRTRVTQLEAEAIEAQKHLGKVRSDHFWERVVQDIHAILPEHGSMHVDRIADRLGADLVEESRSYPEERSLKTLRKKIEKRIFHKRLFFRTAPGEYRRRRPEDDHPGVAEGPGAG